MGEVVSQTTATRRWLAKFLKQSEYFWADLNPLYIQKETSLYHLWSEVICEYSFISSFKPAPNSS